jgi:hypothetical protein
MRFREGDSDISFGTAGDSSGIGPGQLPDPTSGQPGGTHFSDMGVTRQVDMTRTSREQSPRTSSLARWGLRSAIARLKIAPKKQLEVAGTRTHTPGYQVKNAGEHLAISGVYTPETM